MKLVWVKAAVTLLIVGAGALGVVRFLQDPNHSMRRLYILGGVEGSSVAEVERAVVSAGLANFFLTDINAVTAAVEELSWVKSARVTRVWPDALRIDIDRYRAVAIWEDGRLVAADGRLFTANDESIERLAQMPMFTGDPSYSAQAAAYLPAFQDAVAGMKARLKAVNVSFRGSWSVTAESQTMPSVTIELGRAFTTATPVEKLKRVVKHYGYLCRIMQGYPQQIDARYRDAFAAQLPNRASVELWAKENNPQGLKKGES